MKLGAHTSVAGGLYRAVERSHVFAGTALQIFSKNNNRWHSEAIALVADRMNPAHEATVGFSTISVIETTAGQGTEGAFRRIRAHPALSRIPMVVETPKGSDLSQDLENLSPLRSFQPSTNGGAGRRRGRRQQAVL